MRRRGGAGNGRAWLVLEAHQALGLTRLPGVDEAHRFVAGRLAVLTADEADWVRRLYSDELVEYGSLLAVVERRWGPVVEPPREPPPPLRLVGGR